MTKQDKRRKQKLLKVLKTVIAENAREYEAVHIVWRDASGIAYGWSHIDEVREAGAKEPMIHTSGWLLQETPTYALVGLSVDSTESDMCDMVLKIPRENIQCIKKLGKVRF